MADHSDNQKDLPTFSAAGQAQGVYRDAHLGPKSAPEFEGYQILEELPRGGQSVVYKAIHKATKTKVALKVLPPGLLSSARARHLFEREVDILSSLEHPHVVRIRDSGISQGQYYFAAEYVHGMPLDVYVFSKGLTFRATLELFLRVCEAVAYAHQRGVTHRDLKPANILIDERGDPHVLDFGLAKGAGQPHDSPSMMSVTGDIKGTLVYMSPEQACGRSHMVDTRSDVYSLGVVLYQALTREFPYDVSGSMAQTLRNIESIDPIRPKDATGKFDSDVEAILLKALAKEPSARYHSAAELGEDIRRWLNGEPVIAKPMTTTYMLGKLVRRHAYGSAVVILLTLIMLGFSCTYYYLYGQLRKQNVQLEQTVNQLYQEREFNSQISSQLTFEHLLNFWRKGQIDRARSLGLFFDKDGREGKALRFLLDSRPLPEKIDAFQRDLRDREPFFTSLVIAEHHLRDGNDQAALELFQQALEHANDKVDGLLRIHVQDSIADLLAKGQGKARPGGDGR